MNAEIIEGIKDELSVLDAMTEGEAMRLYNTDNKAEYAQAIIDWWYMQSEETIMYEDFIREIKREIQ